MRCLSVKAVRSPKRTCPPVSSPHVSSSKGVLHHADTYITPSGRPLLPRGPQMSCFHLLFVHVSHLTVSVHAAKSTEEGFISKTSTTQRTFGHPLKILHDFQMMCQICREDNVPHQVQDSFVILQMHGVFFFFFSFLGKLLNFPIHRLFPEFAAFTVSECRGEIVLYLRRHVFEDVTSFRLQNTHGLSEMMSLKKRKRKESETNKKIHFDEKSVNRTSESLWTPYLPPSQTLQSCTAMPMHFSEKGGNMFCRLFFPRFHHSSTSD